MTRARPRAAVASGAVALLGLAPLASPAATAPAGTTTVVVRVAHGPVTLPLVDAPPAGPSVGDLRTVWVPLTRPGRTAGIGYLSGSLLTVATDRPQPGQELRTSNLVFVIGRPANQLVVGGIAAYAQAAPTVARRTVTVRPVIGGSGIYDGARGSCTTTRFENDTWTHVFRVRLG